MEVLEWSAFPAVWWDVSEKKKKSHVLAQRWEFVVDFRETRRYVHGQGGGTSGEVEG